MNGLINGKAVPYDEALRQQRQWMQERGITKPRVRIGQYIVPTFRPKLTDDEYKLQSALLGGGYGNNASSA